MAGKVNSGNLLDYILEFEGGEISQEDTVELFSHLVETGQCWTLQGMYGRAACSLIEAGVLDKKGKIDWDALRDIDG